MAAILVSRAPRHEDAGRSLRGLSPGNARSRRMFLGNCSASICSRRRTAMSRGIGGRRIAPPGADASGLNGKIVDQERWSKPSGRSSLQGESRAHRCLAKPGSVDMMCWSTRRQQRCAPAGLTGRPRAAIHSYRRTTRATRFRWRLRSRVKSRRASPRSRLADPTHRDRSRQSPS